MINIKFLIFLMLSAFIFTSCVSTYDKYSNKVTRYFKDKPKNNNLSFDDIAYDLVTPICDKIEDNSNIYITDFVNESNLKNKSQLGFLLSNQTKVNVQKSYCTNNVTIQDLQLAKNLKISKNGSRILTRDVNNIKNLKLKDDKKILTGSYILTENQIIVFLKLMNLKNGNIIISSTTSRQIDDELKSLEGVITNKEKKSKEELKIYKPMHL